MKKQLLNLHSTRNWVYRISNR